MLSYLASTKTKCYTATVNGERFTGLNLHGFHPMKFSTENICGALCLQHLNNAIIRSLYNISKYYGKTFAVLLKTVKNAKV